MKMDKISDIRERYLEITKDKRIGGSAQLYALAKRINQVLKEVPSKYLIPLFVLHTIIKDIAIDQDERPVEVKECQDLYTKLNSEITKLLDDLEKEVEDTVIIEDTINLIKKWI